MAPIPITPPEAGRGRPSAKITVRQNTDCGKKGLNRRIGQDSSFQKNQWKKSKLDFKNVSWNPVDIKGIDTNKCVMERM